MIFELVEKIQRKEELKKAQKIIEKYKLDKQLNEGLFGSTIDVIKQKIIDLLNKIVDNNILNDILVLLNKEKIKESFENIIGNKAGMEKYKDKLIELYISIPGSFENKISFLDELLKNRELEKQKRNTVMSFFDLFEKNNFGKEFIKQLYLFDDKGVGKGELLLLTVFRDTKTIGKGDISTNSHLYEVKARASKTGGRLANNNYPEVLGVNQVKRIIMQILQENQKEYGINLDNIKLPSGKNDYNLKTGADNWLKIMKQLNISENKRKDFMVKVLKEIIKEQWSVSDNDVKWVEKDIKNDGTWDKKFLQDFLYFQVQAYHNIEPFDYMILFNPSVEWVIADLSGIKKLISENILRSNNNISFNDKQSNTYKIYLV